MLLDESALSAWGQRLVERLDAKTEASVSYNVSVKADENSHQFGLQLDKRLHGLTTPIRLSSEFFNGADYQQIGQFVQQAGDLFGTESYVRRGERSQVVSQFSQAYDWLMKEARKGLNIQRYKGLGEMNPDQLWETTMDPENRRLLKVRIEDAIAADEVFTTLMGDHVEPRRDFIEANALNVSNLDV